MYQTILVPLDGSKLAECVLPHVEALVRGSQAKRVVFIRVVEPVYLPPGDYIMPEDQIRKMEAEMREDAQNYLKDIVSRTKYDGARVESAILYGRAADTLADFAPKNQIDIIIIATHGRSGVSRWVWGSVADRILRSSCVPVLMIRAPGCVPGI
jgi:nucleotide-binding universal stress UspA family protein